MKLELTDYHAVLVARDEEVQKKRAGQPYRQSSIDNLDAWLGEVMHVQQQLRRKA